MLDFSWSELGLIAVVALIVIGPKDLPKALRTVGIWVRKARSVSREFQSSIEQMIRDAELDEVKKEIESAARIDLHKEFENTIDPTGELAQSLKPPELGDPGPAIGGSLPPPPDAAPAAPGDAAPAALAPPASPPPPVPAATVETVPVATPAPPEHAAAPAKTAGGS